MLFRPLLRTPALLAVLLLVGALVTYPPAHPIAGAAPRPPTAYVLLGGDSASDNAVMNALTDAGITVTPGVAITGFTGAQADLGDFDLVVALYNQSWATPLQQSGMDAVADYVESGGGLLTGEFLISESDQPAMDRLRPLLPATSCGRLSGASTTLSIRSPNPVINAGLPNSFPVNLSNFGDREGCLTPRPDAAILYTSSNGGADAPGLVAWSADEGRVASFSLLLGATELQSAAMRGLLQNTARWVATTKDLTPPKITGVTLTGAGTLTSLTQQRLTVQASDSGGSRLGSIYVIEYRYSGDAQDAWATVRRSGWQPFGANNGKVVDWAVSNDPGVHFLQVFVSDRAGNVSVSPGLTYLSYQPATATIATDEQRIYRISPPAGQQVTVRMEALSGNPDLYVFGPNVSFVAESDTSVEITSFTATGGTYQIEVEGHLAGSYQLQVTLGTDQTTAIDPADDRRRPRGSIITLNSYTPLPSDAELPAPPTDLPAQAGNTLYLPLLIR